MEHIYHICKREAWDEASKKNCFHSESLAKEGFIHCSKYVQVLRVANTFFRGQENLVLLVIEPGKVRAEIRWEPGMDKPDELFPHIYGDLNLEAVNQILDLNVSPNGQFHLP